MSSYSSIFKALLGVKLASEEQRTGLPASGDAYSKFYADAENEAKEQFSATRQGIVDELKPYWAAFNSAHKEDNNVAFTESLAGIVESAFNHLTDTQRKTIWENRPKRSGKSSGEGGNSERTEERLAEDNTGVPAGNSKIGAFVRLKDGRLACRTTQGWMYCIVEDESLLDKTCYAKHKAAVSKVSSYQGEAVNTVAPIPKAERFRVDWTRIGTQKSFSNVQSVTSTVRK